MIVSRTYLRKQSITSSEENCRSAEFSRNSDKFRIIPQQNPHIPQKLNLKPPNLSSGKTYRKSVGDCRKSGNLRRTSQAYLPDLRRLSMSCDETQVHPPNMRGNGVTGNGLLQNPTPSPQKTTILFFSHSGSGIFPTRYPLPRYPSHISTPPPLHTVNFSFIPKRGGV